MLWIIISVLIIVFLIGISAFFSSSEMAFVSVNRAVIIDKARNGDKKAKILEGLYRDYDTVISAIVIGNNLVNIFASVLAGFVSTEFFGNFGIGVATVVMFLLVIVFSESTPKAFGMKNDGLVLRVARPLSIITKLFSPFVVLLNFISNGLISLLGGRRDKNTAVTEDEIMAMMRLGEEEGTIEKDEREMLMRCLSLMKPWFVRCIHQENRLSLSQRMQRFGCLLRNLLRPVFLVFLCVVGI